MKQLFSIFLIIFFSACSFFSRIPTEILENFAIKQERCETHKGEWTQQQVFNLEQPRGIYTVVVFELDPKTSDLFRGVCIFPKDSFGGDR